MAAASTTAEGGSAASSKVKKKNKKSKQAQSPPQPAWLFHPDAEKLDQKSDDSKERTEVIEHLKRKVLDAPQKPAPPTELMQMINGFFTTYGFSSTSRMFLTEWTARARAVGWEEPTSAGNLSKSPDLINAYGSWRSTLKPNAGVKDKKTSSGASSSSGSDSSSEDSNGSSSSDSDSDSDSTKVESLPVQTIKTSAKLTEGKSSNKLKRKASSASSKSSSSSDSSSASSSSDSDSDRPAKRPKVEAIAVDVKAPVRQKSIFKPVKPSKGLSDADSTSGSSTSRSSSDSSSDSNSEDDKPVKKRPAVLKSILKVEKSPTNLVNGKPGRTSSSSSASDARPYFDATDSPKGEVAAVAVTTTVVKNEEVSPSNKPSDKGSKVTKKISTPFRRIPEDTKIDPRLSSNAYQSYDYADRAYRDLSVTKGKGFTKEKNKKKRGSYRGGAIDIWGAKGIKFDD